MSSGKTQMSIATEMLHTESIEKLLLNREREREIEKFRICNSCLLQELKKKNSAVFIVFAVSQFSHTVLFLRLKTVSITKHLFADVF